MTCGADTFDMWCQFVHCALVGRLLSESPVTQRLERRERFDLSIPASNRANYDLRQTATNLSVMGSVKAVSSSPPDPEGKTIGINYHQSGLSWIKHLWAVMGMSESGLAQIAVLGAGVLGGQIAWHSAYMGKTVVVYDPFEESLERCRDAQDQYAEIYQQDLGATDDEIAATRARLSLTTELATAAGNADLVIEAVPEIPNVKTALYQELSGVLPEHTLVATNSSTLLPSQFADASGRPEKFCCLHFANLIWSLNLAEVMAHPRTSSETILSVTRFAIEIGMIPVPVQKEHNAYVINSLLVPLLNAAQTLVTNGISTPEAIDRTYMVMNRGCARGPCGVIDIVGMETAYNILSHWGTENQDEQMLANADYIKREFIDRGNMGLQTGQGYYSYPEPAYAAEDFLDIPDIGEAEAYAALVKA